MDRGRCWRRFPKGDQDRRTLDQGFQAQPGRNDVALATARAGLADRPIPDRDLHQQATSPSAEVHHQTRSQRRSTLKIYRKLMPLAREPKRKVTGDEQFSDRLIRRNYHGPPSEKE